MPTKRLSMRRIRDLLRLKHAQGLSEREISAALGSAPPSGLGGRARSLRLAARRMLPRHETEPRS